MSPPTTPPTPPALPRSVGRPRSETTHQSILDAAVDLLENESYQAVSINRIAEQAGVSKQTIYRWWDAKADLVLEAYTRRVFKRGAPPDATEDAFLELQKLLEAFFETLQEPRVNRGLRSLIAEAQFDPAFRTKFLTVFVSTRRNLMRQALDHGVALGQIRRDADLDLVLDVIYGAFWYRLLSGTTAPLDPAFAHALIELVRPTLTLPRKSRAAK
jgi:AcrR family transcriptional regulator